MSQIPRVCIWCSVTFYTKRRDHITCSGRCRIALHRFKERRSRDHGWRAFEIERAQVILDDYRRDWNAANRVTE